MVCFPLLSSRHVFRLFMCIEKQANVSYPPASCQDSVMDHCGRNHGQNPGAIFQSGDSQIMLKTQRPLLRYPGTAPSRYWSNTIIGGEQLITSDRPAKRNWIRHISVKPELRAFRRWGFTSRNNLSFRQLHSARIHSLPITPGLKTEGWDNYTSVSRTE